jgi:hypothetical protein
MGLDELCRTVRNQVLDLGTYLWEEPPVTKETRTWLKTRREKLKQVLDRRRSLAGRLRADLVELRRRLAHQEKSAVFLMKRIEIFHGVGDKSGAWSYALQLERLRETMSHNRARLHQLENIHKDHLAVLERLQIRVADLQEHIHL